jgi:hypothetical protein
MGRVKVAVCSALHTQTVVPLLAKEISGGCTLLARTIDERVATVALCAVTQLSVEHLA